MNHSLRWYKRLPGGMPNRSSLSEAFGFPVPVQFTRLIETLFKRSGGNLAECDRLFSEAFHLDLAGETARYPNTPAELFPFAQMGVDGVHYGYLIHSRELNQSDYPVVELSPMDGDGVFLIGANTLEGVENLLSQQLEYAEGTIKGFEGGEDPDKQRELIRYVGAALGLNPAADKARRIFGDEGNGLRVVPDVPKGWRYIPSADGVGVLAAESAFSADPLPKFSTETVIDDYIELAVRVLERGYPATALYYLREGYWNNWYSEELSKILSRRLIDAYEALGRPLLSGVVRRRIGLR
jgi:hypothetical protein